MRAFSSSPHPLFMASVEPEEVQSVQLRPAHLAIAVGLILACGVALGGYAASLPASQAGKTPEPTTAPSVATPSASLAAVDAAGVEIDGLPRFPGAVRTAHEVLLERGFRLIANEYQAEATVDDVRTFYQAVIAEHGWERADINFDHGEWSYVLVNGGVEALIEIEEFGGLVEIDLQLSEPTASPTPIAEPREPAATPPPTPAPVAPPPPQPPAPAPPPGDGDDEDDGGGDDDSDDGGGGSDDD